LPRLVLTVWVRGSDGPDDAAGGHWHLRLPAALVPAREGQSFAPPGRQTWPGGHWNGGCAKVR